MQWHSWFTWFLIGDMDVTLSPNTLIPVGSIGTVVALVYWVSKKVNALGNLQEYAADAKKILAEAIRKADFDKHIAEDAIFHTSVLEKINTMNMGQARTEERLANIERSLVMIQSDLKKVLEK